jgi:hypothetical protein
MAEYSHGQGKSMSEYDLAKSGKAIGKLYPILKDKHGNIIDGFHRLEADPEWPSVTVDAIDNPKKLALARLVANACRRGVLNSEMLDHISFLMKSEHMTVKEIATETGIDETTIYPHIPPELKPTGEKISQGLKHAYEIARHEVDESTPSSKTSDIHTCDFCNVRTSEPVDWSSYKLCPTHYKQALMDSARFKRFLAFKFHELPITASSLKCPKCGYEWSPSNQE